MFYAQAVFLATFDLYQRRRIILNWLYCIGKDQASLITHLELSLHTPSLYNECLGCVTTFAAALLSMGVRREAILGKGPGKDSDFSQTCALAVRRAASEYSCCIADCGGNSRARRAESREVLGLYQAKVDSIRHRRVDSDRKAAKEYLNHILSTVSLGKETVTLRRVNLEVLSIRLS